MDKRRLMAGALSASLVVSALPGLALAQEEASPEAVRWTLTSLAGDPLPDGVEPTLFMSGGSANGDAGCNSYFGSYELDGDSLTFPEPFGVSAMFCEGAPMEVEDAYLPLLQATAGWAIADGVLSLSDADGTVQLTYIDKPVTVTETDVAALDEALADLQTQIDEASAAVTALAEEAASVNVNKIRKRIAANEDAIAALEKKTKGLNVNKINNRLAAAEAAIADLQAKHDALRQRVKDAEKRITALEEAVFVPTPLPE